MRWLRQQFVKREEMPADGGAAPAAPAPTPAEPVPTPAPAAEPVAAPAPTVTYKSSAAQQLAEMVTQAGMNPSEVLKAIQGNNGVATPEIYAALQAKHGDGMASLLTGQMSQLHETNVTASAKADKAIFDQVEKFFEGVTKQSGEETFKELSTWAKANLPQDKVDQMNALIKAGGMGAQLAIQELTTSFQNSGDYTQPPQLMEGDNTPANNSGGGDLTRQEHNEAVRKLVQKGHRHGTSQEIAALGRRRTKSMSRGIN
jgi:hypothetical protein